MYGIVTRLASGSGHASEKALSLEHSSEGLIASLSFQHIDATKPLELQKVIACGLEQIALKRPVSPTKEGMDPSTEGKIQSQLNNRYVSFLSN